MPVAFNINTGSNTPIYQQITQQVRHAVTTGQVAVGEQLPSVRALAEERRVAGIVLGLPLNMDGSEGPRAQSARAYARNLAPLDLPVLLWDERWSTASAERDLIAQDVSRAKRAERIDSHAAAVILQAALDALAGGMF